MKPPLDTAGAISYNSRTSVAVTIESTQIDHGTAETAGDVIFSEEFAHTPVIVSSAGVAGATAAGFTIGGPGDWIAIGPSKISRPIPV